MQFVIAITIIIAAICLFAYLCEFSFRNFYTPHDRSDKIHKERIKQMRESDKKQRKRDREKAIENKYLSHLKKE